MRRASPSLIRLVTHPLCWKHSVSVPPGVLSLFSVCFAVVVSSLYSVLNIQDLFSLLERRFRWQTKVNQRSSRVPVCLTVCCGGATQLGQLDRVSGGVKASLNLLSFWFSPVGFGKCLKAQWLANVGFKQP